jgi:hypothetical protein
MSDPERSAEFRERAAVALVFALVTAIFTAARVWHEPNWPTDFDQLWYAARAVVNGQNPYDAVGPGKPFPWNWPLLYPMPAVLFAVPFTVVPVAVARIAFSTTGAALLGWALGGRVRTHWPMLLSAAFIIAASRAQWSPFLLAAAWLPGLGFLISAKPNVGLAALASQDRPGLLWGLAGSTVILALSFVVQPDWYARWREATNSALHIQAAITALPAGPVLVLAALRWRRPEARLLLALSVVPHTPSLYDLLLLFFVCRTVRETLTLALLTQVLYWSIVLFGSFMTFDAYASWLGRWAVMIVYVPVLIAVLLRPNTADDERPEDRQVPFHAFPIPRTWPDTFLLSALLIAATMLVWLPLVTYR